MLEKISEEIKKHFLFYLILAVFLIAAFIIRVYRVNEILGFYYDQGRDALVIWDLWHKGKFFLIGPTTGIAGIFRGPFYYYLIAPFYILGKGNPVWPAVFLALSSTVAVFIMYYLGMKIQGRTTGLIAAFLGSFSMAIVYASRWLSNPTPMLFLSMILVWMMFLVLEGKRWAWIIISLVAGLSLFHFGSSGELFYFFALAIFAFWQRKYLPNRKIFLISLGVFFATFAPLLFFDIRHGGILRGNIAGFLFTGKSFAFPTWIFIQDKLQFYYGAFSSKIFINIHEKEIFILGALGFFFLYYLPKLLKNAKTKVLLLLLASPIIGLIFFQGNYGNLYDYYLTGYYLIFLLLVAVVLGYLFRSPIGKILVIYFLYFFLVSNWLIIKQYITDPGTALTSISFSNEKQAIDWIYKDSGTKDFNIDVYVPPVIPYAYDYLFKWYGGSIHGREPIGKLIPLLYTIYEVDPPHPERLETWLARQKGIGKILEEQRFGGIVVQRRERL